jgi:DNA transformation protein
VSADQLIAHGLDLFAPLGPGVSARRMFGALGFYADGLFFAVGEIEEGALYLKVDELTRAAFEAAGGRPFTYRAKDGGVMVMSYLTPPEAALEDPEAMWPWARLALEAAARAAAAKASKGRERPGTKPKSRPPVKSGSKAAKKAKAAVVPSPKAAVKSKSRPTRRASTRR